MPVAVPQVGGHLRAGLVGGVGQFDEGDLLVGMVAVPALQQRAEVAREVTGGGQGERPAPALDAHVGAGARGDMAGQEHDEDERPLPAAWIHRIGSSLYTLVHRSGAMYTC